MLTAAPPAASSAASRVDRDLAFSAADFERVRAMIRAKAGIDLGPAKQNMVYSRLQRRVRERGDASFAAYLDSLRGETDPEWQEFINCLTTNLTAFFREPHHFEMLARHLPDWGKAGPVRLWSCAASTGEEPYSIAMTVAEAGLPPGRVQIEASDIDTRVLATAAEATYTLDAVRGLSDQRLRRFFLRGVGRHEGKVRVQPTLAGQVALRSFNLLSGTWPGQRYEAIFCRNVMIYFDRPTQRQVLERLCAVLRPGGLLFVGHSENFTEHRDLVELVGKTTYRLRGT